MYNICQDVILRGKCMNSRHPYTKRVIGFIGIWGVIVTQTVLTMLYWQERMAETIVMDLGILVVLLLGMAGQLVWSRIVALALPIGYVIQRLLLSIRYSGEIGPAFFVWMVLPVVLHIFFCLFSDGEIRVHQQLDIMIEEQKDLVMISQTTGLYNIRCLQYDLRMQQAYCDRNNLTLALMAVRYAWAQDACRMLGGEKYRAVLQKIGIILVDDVRVEDRVYDLDGEGVYGVLMICDRKSMEAVKTRLENVVRGIDLTDVVGDQQIVPIITTTCREFDKEEFGNDAILFARTVYNEIRQ